MSLWIYFHLSYFALSNHTINTFVSVFFVTCSSENRQIMSTWILMLQMLLRETLDSLLLQSRSTGRKLCHISHIKIALASVWLRATWCGVIPLLNRWSLVCVLLPWRKGGGYNWKIELHSSLLVVGNVFFGQFYFITFLYNWNFE